MDLQKEQHACIATSRIRQFIGGILFLFHVQKRRRENNGKQSFLSILNFALSNGLTPGDKIYQ
jgi:hypothetical protein